MILYNICRLINNRVGNQWLRDTNGLVSFARPVTLKVTQVEPPKVESHDERNMRMRRPQSPHLTIYAPQLTSMLSISHRFSGLYFINSLGYPCYRHFILKFSRCSVKPFILSKRTLQ